MPEIALNPPPFNPHGEKGESGVLMAETGDGTQGCAKTSTPVRVRGQGSGVKLRTRNREPGTENREPGTENQEPGTENQEPGTENQEPGTENREPGSTFKTQPSNVQPSASSRDIFGCSKNRQNRIVENSTYPLDDFGFR